MRSNRNGPSCSPHPNKAMPRLATIGSVGRKEGDRSISRRSGKRSTCRYTAKSSGRSLMSRRRFPSTRVRSMLIASSFSVLSTALISSGRAK